MMAHLTQTVENGVQSLPDRPGEYQPMVNGKPFGDPVVGFGNALSIYRKNKPAAVFPDGVHSAGAAQKFIQVVETKRGPEVPVPPEPGKVRKLINRILNRTPKVNL